MSSFQNLLDGLMSADGSTRNAAEATWNQAQENALGEAVTNLVHTLSSDANEGRRGLAAVLLRRSVERFVEGPAGKIKAWDTLTPDVKNVTKQGILAAFSNESVGHVQKKVTHVVAEVATQEAGEGCKNWPELLTTCMTQLQSTNDTIRESTLFLLSTLLEYTGETVLGPHAGQLHSILQVLLGDASLRVAAAAVGTTSNIITSLDDEAARAPYVNLIPVMMGILEKSLSAQEESIAQDVLKSFIDIATFQARFLRPYLEPACSAMLSIVNFEGFEESTRQLGLEFLLALAEVAGSTVRKFPKLIEAVLQLSLKFLALADEDCDEWLQRDNTPTDHVDDENDVEHDLMRAGADACVRLSSAIGGKVLLPIFRAQMAELLNSQDWRLRRAALVAFCCILEGVAKALIHSSKTITQDILPFLSDTHPRVRFAALRAIGVMAQAFGDPDEVMGDVSESVGDLAWSLFQNKTAATSKGSAGRAKQAALQPARSFQDSCAEIVLPALIQSLGALNASFPRLRGFSAGVLVEFLVGETVTGALITPYANDMMNGLYALLSDLPENFTYSKGHALSAIGCVANQLQDGFQQYYGGVIAPLKNLIQSTTTETSDQRTVRGHALQCLSLVVEAVGKEVSGIDAAECINFILRGIASENNDEDNESFRYVGPAISRLANCLGPDFAPYLPYAIPLLLARATKEIKFTITEEGEGDDDEADANFQQAIVNTAGGGTRRVAIDSTAVEDRSTAMASLTQMQLDLGVSVPAWRTITDHVGPALLEGLDTFFETIRVMAAASAPGYLRAAMVNTDDKEHATRALRLIITKGTKQLPRERSMEALLTLSEALEQCLKLAYTSSLPDFDGENDLGTPLTPGSFHPPAIPFDLLPEFFKALKQVLEQSVQRRVELNEQLRENADADEEDIEELQNELNSDNDLLMHVTDCIGYCIKSYKEAIIPVLSTELGPYMMNWLLLTDEVQIPSRAAAICLIDDLVEYATGQSTEILQNALPHILPAVSSPNPLLRQPAVYGIGVFASKLPEVLEPHAKQLHELLLSQVFAPESRSGDMHLCTDNAISTLIKLATAYPNLVNVDMTFDTVVNYLPIRCDCTEGVVVHKLMVEKTMQSDSAWIGPNGSRAKAILVALAKAIILHKFAETDLDDPIYPSLKAVAPQSLGKGDAWDEEEEETFDELLDKATLNMLPQLAALLKQGPAAPLVEQILSQMPQHLRMALGQFGF